uniref:clp protease proteolytic subunit n=1 Tax=Zantedeschia elliottiana TaxID=94108 RepID=UPI002A82A768|nr:clp protease proteolytic subunit [Zantedeschia elliottiana]WNZ34184.1 clp protease proteolytic subunit [Zantedeschia elliottiana]
MPVGIPKIPYVVVQDIDGKEDETWVEIFDILSRERILFLGAKIDSELANEITGLFMYLNLENPRKKFHLLINSPGGSVMGGVSIFDSISYVKSAVHTTCIGRAASIASLILSGGTPGERTAFPHARIMIHQPLSTFFDGNPIIHTREINEVLELRDMLVHMYMGTTLQSHMQILSDLERDEFMSTQGAIFYGLIDSVSQDPFGCIDMERIRYDINAIKRDDGDTPSTSAFGVGDNSP